MVIEKGNIIDRVQCYLDVKDLHLAVEVDIH